MFSSLLIIPFLLTLLAMTSVFLFRTQFILILLSMELAMLGLFLMMTMVLKPLVISLYLLVMGAVEASIGLSLVVLMTRMSGLDLLNLLNLSS